MPVPELRHVKPEPISLKKHPNLGEVWLHQRVAEDPAILGLGDLILLHKERAQMGAGRLDLLLADDD